MTDDGQWARNRVEIDDGINDIRAADKNTGYSNVS